MKILMLGLGGAGQRHLRILSELLGSDAEFIAYRKRDRKFAITKAFEIEKNQTVEEKYGVASYYDLDEAIRQKPDIAFISNPTSEHIPAALVLAKAGINFFIEKPLSQNLAGIAELVTIVRDRSLITYMGYQMRFHPCIQRMKQLLEHEKIGHIFSCRMEIGSFMPSWHSYEDYRELYASRKDLGGGVILTESHELDYFYWFFGMPKRVFALGGKFSNYDIDVEDTVSILFDFNYGDHPTLAQLNMCFVQQPPSRSCQMYGEKGAIVWDGTNKLSVFDSLNDKWEHSIFEGFEREDMFISELKHFLACVEGKEKPLVDLDAGLSSLKIALAAHQSMATGKLVVL